jgi:hypothetical protein
MVWKKPSQKNGKRKTSRIAASDGAGLAGLFSIIILILLIAPVLSMAQNHNHQEDSLMWMASGCKFTAQAREAQL